MAAQASPQVAEAMQTVEGVQQFIQSDTASNLATLGGGAVVLIAAAVIWALFANN